MKKITLNELSFSNPANWILKVGLSMLVLVFSFNEIQATTLTTLNGNAIATNPTQDIKVKGKVTDASGNPLPGVNILVVGTTKGTTSDFDGNYEISAPSNSKLQFSYVGFTNKEVAVDGKTTINVSLAEAANQLNEVVLIGYGSTTKKDATGAIDAVKSEDFNKGAIASPEQLLQGKSAGVQITQASGEPGAGINIRIRGTSSVRSNNNPLFVVDGVPISSDNSAAGGADVGFGGGAAKNPLNFLNPNDIKSMSVLKDASATAIYGSRGANGVIIIETKSGKANKANAFEYSSTMSVASPAKKYPLLNGPQFLAAVTQFGGDAGALDAGANTDWQNVVTRTSISNEHNLSYSRSYTGGNVRASVGYSNLAGVVKKSDLERITGRLNINQKLFKDKLDLSLQGTLSRVNDRAAAISTNAGFQGDLLGAAYTANPTWPSLVTFNPGGSNLNPSQMLEYIQSKTKTNRALLNLSGTYDITKDLSAKLTLGYDGSTSNRGDAVSGLIDGFTNGTNGNGRAALNDINLTSRLMEYTMNYKKDFSNSKLDALVGYSYQSFGRSGRSVSGWGFSTTYLNGMVGDLTNSTAALEKLISTSYQQYGYSAGGFFVNSLFPSIATTNLTAPSGISVKSVAADTFDYSDELQSFFGRVNYTLADKYLFTATVRADGSSKFGGSNKYGIFPSAAFAWKLDQEDFIPEAFSTLKLRVGYGVTGNQDGVGYGNFLRRSRFAGIGIDNGGAITVPGTNTVSFANPNLKWESTSQINVGFDFGFENDRINGSIDYYKKDTKDFLLQTTAAQPSPQPFFFTNINADIINQGVEFAINYDVIKQENTNWNVGFNISYNDNMVKNFGGLVPFGQIFGQGLTGAYSQMLAGGHPLFSYYLRDFQGYDANGQQIGDVQKFVGKSALPKINLGLSTSFSYKQWDASASISGQYGQYIYNNTANAYFTAGSIAGGRNVTSNVLTSGEAGNNAPDVSTRFLESGDFTRLQNVTIGYNFKLGEASFLKSLKMYVTGQNLFVITPYSGLDPEVNTTNVLNNVPSFGVDYSAFPTPRTYTFGLNATF